MSIVDRVRHGRQIRLPEIGEAGQARLVATAVDVGSLPRSPNARALAETYLRASGVSVTSGAGAVDDGSRASDVAASLGIVDPAAREAAEGAVAALLVIRAALGIEGR